MQKIDRFLRLMNDRGASDLHLTVGRPPMLRVSGSMESIRFRVITEVDFSEMLSAIAPERIWDDFQRTGDVDFSHDLPGVARYRVNLFRQQRGAG
ncbi:MAG TPA: type IV pili twitching motility protein PilT, partial [Thermoanaerobaculia bacterium]|nr:type IV pili twitching motility protein PilT [Thermoanaerobaculia bacterium]